MCNNWFWIILVVWFLSGGQTNGFGCGCGCTDTTTTNNGCYNVNTTVRRTNGCGCTETTTTGNGCGCTETVPTTGCHPTCY